MEIRNGRLNDEIPGFVPDLDDAADKLKRWSNDTMNRWFRKARIQRKQKLARLQVANDR